MRAGRETLQARRYVAAMMVLALGWALAITSPPAVAVGETTLTGTLRLGDGLGASEIYVEALTQQRDPETQEDHWIPTAFEPAFRVTGRGTFEIDLPAGDYRLVFRHQYSEAPDVFYPGVFDLDSAQTVAVRSARLDLGAITVTPFAVLRGLVTVPEGMDAQSVTARLWRVADDFTLIEDEFYDGPVDSDAETPEIGPYEVRGLTSGYYALEFISTDPEISGGWYVEDHDTFPPTRGVAQSVEQTTPLWIDLGQELDGVDAVLVARGRVSGRVLDADGAPLRAGLEVSAYPTRGASGADVEAVVTVTVAEDGTYLLQGLLPGTYRIGVRDPSGEWLSTFHPSAESWQDAQIVTVRSSETTHGVTVTAPRAGVIQGTVTLPAGVSPQEVRVVAYARAGGVGAWEPVSEAWLGDDRVYRLGGLAPDVYRVGFLDDSGTAEVLFHGGGASVDRGTDVIIGPGSRTRQIDATLVARAATVSPQPSVGPTGSPTGGPTSGPSVKPDVKTPTPTLRPVVRPRLKGAVRVGRTVRVTRGSYRPAKVTVKYAWFIRKGPGAKATRVGTSRASLKVKKAWRTRQVRVRVTITRPGHQTLVVRTPWSTRIKR